MRAAEAPSLLTQSRGEKILFAERRLPDKEPKRLTMEEPLCLKGLIAAVHTPFNPRCELALEVVERQAEHLIRQGI